MVAVISSQIFLRNLFCFGNFSNVCGKYTIFVITFKSILWYDIQLYEFLI